MVAADGVILKAADVSVVNPEVSASKVNPVPIKSISIVLKVAVPEDAATINVPFRLSAPKSKINRRPIIQHKLLK